MIIWYLPILALASTSIGTPPGVRDPTTPPKRYMKHIKIKTKMKYSADNNKINSNW